MELSLPPIAAEHVRRAALTFKKATSVGCDAFPPRSIAALSDRLREAIGDFLIAVERQGTWPQGVATALIHLIPKTDGGRRPIGVLPTIVLIWENVRKPAARA